MRINWKSTTFKTQISKYVKYTCGDFTLILARNNPSSRDMLFLKNTAGQDTLIKKGPFARSIYDFDFLELLFL